MKRFFIVNMAVMLFVSTFLFAGSVPTAAAKESKTIEFNTMAGVPRPYTGATNAIRTIPGGGLPWVVGSAQGELKANGKLEIHVSGLVIDPNDPTAISRGVAGTNPSPTFKAIVSCLSKDADGNPTTVNVSTGEFDADAKGNSKIEDTVVLPTPCLAPIIFVANPAGAWFATTGF